MVRCGEERLDGRLLDHLAAVHHHHSTRRLGHHAEVVRDEHDGGAVLALQRGEQVEDLRLDRDVERGGRLVGDDDGGAEDQRHGDHHALAHPPES
jgi:hypothetical protein